MISKISRTWKGSADARTGPRGLDGAAGPHPGCEKCSTWSLGDHAVTRKSSVTVCLAAVHEKKANRPFSTSQMRLTVSCSPALSCSSKSVIRKIKAECFCLSLKPKALAVRSSWPLNHWKADHVISLRLKGCSFFSLFHSCFSTSFLDFLSHKAIEISQESH